MGGREAALAQAMSIKVQAWEPKKSRASSVVRHAFNCTLLGASHRKQESWKLITQSTRAPSGDSRTHAQATGERSAQRSGCADRKRRRGAASHRRSGQATQSYARVWPAPACNNFVSLPASSNAYASTRALSLCTIDSSVCIREILSELLGRITKCPGNFIPFCTFSRWDRGAKVRR